MSLENVFNRMPDLFRADRAAGLTATYLFICGSEEHDTFQVHIANQTLTIQKGQSKKPDVTIRVTSEDWIAISENKLDGIQAYLSGKIKIEGDLSLFQKFSKLFRTNRRRTSTRPLDEIIERQVTKSGEKINVSLTEPNSVNDTCLWGTEEYLRYVLEGTYFPNAFFLAGHLSWRGDADSLSRFCEYCKLHPIKDPKPSIWKLIISLIKLKLRLA